MRERGYRAIGGGRLNGHDFSLGCLEMVGGSSGSLKLFTLMLKGDDLSWAFLPLLVANPTT